VAWTYDLPDLPWEKVAGRLEQVAIAVLRLDARLAAGFVANPDVGPATAGRIPESGSGAE
jgi:hypothetical protein